MTPIKAGIIGTGAVAELCHLPAAQHSPEIQVIALVDKNLERARSLAARFGVPQVMADYHDLFGLVDSVIIALPHYLHAAVSIEFLERGLAVLIEKPMALTIEEAKSIITAADVNGVALQAGHMYRFCNGARLVKRAIDESWLGTLQSFSLESGLVYNWPVASGFLFSKAQAGGGVLVDTGSHMLDLLLWWLGSPVNVEYQDDSLGGVEADCHLLLVLSSPTGPIQGSVALSRLRKLSDTARVVGNRFTIEYDLSTPDKVRIWPSTWDSRCLSFLADFSSPPRQSWNDVYAEQLRAFARAVVSGGKSAVPGESVLGCIALIEQCYRERQCLELPWMTPIAPTQPGAAEV
jgi:predicted dehydrogenase